MHDAIRGNITRHISGGSDALVEVEFEDVHGKKWQCRLNSKLVTDADLDATSRYPQQCHIPCGIVEQDTARQVAKIDTTARAPIAALDGTSRFEVATSILTFRMVDADKKPRESPPIDFVTERGFHCQHVYLQYPPAGWDAETVWKVGEEPGFEGQIGKYSVLFEERCTMIAPDGLRFGCLQCRGDAEGADDYIKVVAWYADKHGLSLGRIRADAFVLSDGSQHALTDCQFVDAYILDGTDRGPGKDDLWGPWDEEKPKKRRSARHKAKTDRPKNAGRKSAKKCTKAIKIAQQCLASPGHWEVVEIREFADDVQSHDDDLQDRYANEIDAAFKDIAAELEAQYGTANVTEQETDFEPIKVSCVYRAAFWKVRKTMLYLAAAHEDRDTPLLLVVGTIAQ